MAAQKSQRGEEHRPTGQAMLLGLVGTVKHSPELEAERSEVAAAAAPARAGKTF